MHVHANYSLQLAAMGSNRDEIHELAARRAAEVRRRLAASHSPFAQEEDEVAFVKVAAPIDADALDDAYSAADGEQQQPDPEIPVKREHGSLFSARA